MPKASGARRAITGVLDQLLYSWTNFVMTVSIAHYASAGAFGAFSVLAATLLIASATSRGGCSEPLLIRSQEIRGDEDTAPLRAGAARAVLFGLAGSVLFVVVGVGFLPDAAAGMTIVFAVSAPALFVQDYLRYVALALGKPGAAFENDLCVTVCQLAGTAVLVAAGALSPTWFVAVWALGGLAGGMWGYRRLRRHFRPTSRRPSQDAPLAARLAADNLATQASQQGVAYLVAGTASLAAAGGFKSAQTVFTVPSVVGIGLQSALVPELARLRARSLRQMIRMLAVTAVVLALVIALFALAALELPTSLGVKLLGESWPQARPVLGLIACGILAGAISLPAITGLRVLADGRRTLAVRTTGVVLTLGAAVPASIAHGAVGAAEAVAGASAVLCVLWWAALWQSYQEAARHSWREKTRSDWELLMAQPIIDGATGHVTGQG